MSHLYYAYGAENAAGSPPSVHPPPPPHRRSPQAWSVDPRRAAAPLPLSHFSDLPPAPAQPLSSPPPMNSTRPVPPSSRPSPYDDNLFHVMGKGFADPSQPQPASSPTPRPLQHQQPPFTQSLVPPSAVFDPSEFPSLGAVGAHVSMQPVASSLLDNNPAIDHNLTNPSLSAPNLNALAPYQDLYSLGAYADSRVKAVDALTASSAPSEFSMQSEDFPALGGASASAALRHVNASPAIPNGAYHIDSSSLRASLQKAPLTESFYDRKLSAASSQAHTVLGRANARQEAARMAQTSARVPNGLTTADAISSLQQLHQAASAHVGAQQQAFRDGRASSPTRAATGGAANGAQLEHMRSRPGDLEKRFEQYDALDSREAPSRQTLPSQISKPMVQQESRFSRSRMANGQSAPMSSEALALGARSRAGAAHDPNLRTSGPFRSDKFGMLSLLPLVCSGGHMTRKERVLAIGIDLTALGLNLNSHEPLYKTFHTPWEGGQGKAGDGDFGACSAKGAEPEYRLPTCYYMQPPALRTNHFSKFQLETLFYIFYIMPHDVLQLLAAVELYNRKWRYHKALKLWFTCELEASSGYDGGYIYFDIKSWGKREFHEVNDNQSFIKGFMTEEELACVKIPPL